MIILLTFCLTDFVAVISCLAVVVGVIFGFHTWNKSMTIKRAEYMQSLREKFYDDKDIAEIVYMADYGVHWYDASFHGGSDRERKVDKLLSVCEHVCYLYDNKLITRKEFDFFEYDLRRLLTNYDFVAYLFNVYHWSNVTLMVKTPFYQLVQFGKRMKYFREDFFDSKSQNYPHFLNF